MSDSRWRRRDQDANGGQAGTYSHRSTAAGVPTPLSVLAQLAGYDTRCLEGLPVDAVRSASGCGTPVTVSDLLPGEVVLVLGPGADLDLLLAASRVGPAGRAIGILWDEVSIGRARTNVDSAGFDNVEVRRAELVGLPVADGAVDWVIGNRAISLCQDKAKLLAEIHRVLKPGGRVSWAEIVAEGLPSWVRTGGWSWLSWVATAMTEAEFISGLTEAGLEDVRDGGRYVYSVSDLTAIAESMGASGVNASTAAGFAEEVVGGVWSAYFSARNPLSGEAGENGDEKEESK